MKVPPTHLRRRRAVLTLMLGGLLVVTAIFTLRFQFAGPQPFPIPLTVAAASKRPPGDASRLKDTPPPLPTEAPTPTPSFSHGSLLHPRTTAMAPLQGERLTLGPAGTHDSITETTQLFAQHGRDAPGIHFRLENDAILSNRPSLQQDPLLLLVVLNDHTSYGPGRTSSDLFQLIGNFTHPTHQTSLTILTSSMDEFHVIRQAMRQRISQYAQFSLLFRNDFKVHGLTRDNRHDDNVQAARRSMLARYRNFALLSTLTPWHQHVVWLDADVHVIPPGLVTKMIHADHDILEPICFSGDVSSTFEYDRNAWVGVRAAPGERKHHTKFMSDFRDRPDAFVPLDSVGGTMLYVKADIHRQGVVFATHYVVGTTWESDGYDAIETEGLCYAAHFLGYKCWGMPHDAIYHVA